jgi:hypothetical protein
MHIYTQIYEFAASAGALEGYVYGKDTLDEKVMNKWCDNLVNAYKLFPPEALKEFQTPCNGTLGRAIRSISSVMGEDHEIVGKIKSMVKGNLPESADDFHKKKWFQE